MIRDSLQRGATYLTISSILFLVTSYFTSIIVGRFLGPYHYGIFGLVISFITITNIIQTNGIPQAASKLISENSGNSESILKSSFVLQTLLTLLITLPYFFTAGFLANIFNDKELEKYIKISAFIIPLYAWQAIYTGYYNGLGYFVKQSFLVNIFSISKVVYVISFTFLWHLVGTFIGFILASLTTLLAFNHFPMSKVTNFSYRKLTLLSLPLLLFALFSNLQQVIDLYFIKILLEDKESAGYYTAVQNISKIPYFILSAFSVILLPSISERLVRKKEKDIKILIKNSLRITLIILVPLTLIIASLSYEMIELFYSRLFIPAYPVLSILVFAFEFLTLFTILGNILNGAGMIYKSLLTSLIGLSITSCCCLLLIPTLGMQGAAFSTAIGGFVAMVAAAGFVYKRFKVLVSIESVVRICGAALIVVLVTYFVKVPILLLPVWYLLLFGGYFGILVFLGEIGKKDWEMVLKVLPERGKEIKK